MFLAERPLTYLAKIVSGLSSARRVRHRPPRQLAVQPLGGEKMTIRSDRVQQARRRMAELLDGGAADSSRSDEQRPPPATTRESFR